MGSVAREFEWVKARAACSVLVVFNELRMGVEEDVKTINSTLRPEVETPLLFSVRSNMAGDCFVVFASGNANRRVEFNCQVDHIEIITANDDKLSVSLTLNNEGRCKLRIGDGEELEQWQVRRVALEKLFFEE